jgi:hypothetical protein
MGRILGSKDVCVVTPPFESGCTIIVVKEKSGRFGHLSTSREGSIASNITQLLYCRTIYTF